MQRTDWLHPSAQKPQSSTKWISGFAKFLKNKFFETLIAINDRSSPKGFSW